MAATTTTNHRTVADSADNISDAVTTDHGSNVVVMLQNTIRLDCLCHRSHMVMEAARHETKASEDDTVTYEAAVCEH